MKNLLFSCLLFASILKVAAASPVLTLDSDTGKLTGALGVTVSGALYDVAFMGGTCIDRFDGCNSLSDFTFNTGDDALIAANVLLDTVFLGAYDLDPLLTRGCASSLFCDIYTPFRFFLGDDGLTRVSSAVARNWLPGVTNSSGFASVLSISNFGEFQDSDKIWAVWSPAQVTAVPEPETYTMFLAGLGLLGFLSRHRKQRAA